MEDCRNKKFICICYGKSMNTVETLKPKIYQLNLGFTDCSIEQF